MKLGEVCLLTGDVCRLADFYRKLMDIEETSYDPIHQFKIIARIIKHKLGHMPVL